MTSQFSPKVSEILVFSQEEATRLSSTSIGPEHLLLGILRDHHGPVADLFERMNVDVSSVKTELEQHATCTETQGKATATELSLNEKANNILKLAVLEARIQHTSMVDVEHLLLAILHDQANNSAKQVLNHNHVDYDEALAYLHQKTSGGTKDGIGMAEDDEMEEEEFADSSRQDRQSVAQKNRQTGKTTVLDNFSIDLTKAAAEGKLDPVVGREKEIMRVTEILCRRKKNNPILIGEPGVGKSAIVEGLAQMIAQHRTSPILFNKRLVNLDMTAIVAGT